MNTEVLGGQTFTEIVNLRVACGMLILSQYIVGFSDQNGQVSRKVLDNPRIFGILTLSNQQSKARKNAYEVENVQNEIGRAHV